MKNRMKCGWIRKQSYILLVNFLFARKYCKIWPITITMLLSECFVEKILSHYT